MDSQAQAGIESKRERLADVNKLIAVIASTGRKFFRRGERVATLELSASGRVFYIDAYAGRRIYTHYRYEWRGFSEGGTLRSLVIALRDYVTKGTPVNPSTFGPWPSWNCGGDLWGYGADMCQVREAARELGIMGTAS